MSDRGFSKCQKSKRNQQARTGRNKIDRRKAEDAPRVVAETAVDAPVVTAAAIVVETVADAPVESVETVETAAGASMVLPKSISTS